VSVEDKDICNLTVEYHCSNCYRTSITGMKNMIAISRSSMIIYLHDNILCRCGHKRNIYKVKYDIGKIVYV